MQSCVEILGSGPVRGRPFSLAGCQGMVISFHEDTSWKKPLAKLLLIWSHLLPIEQGCHLCLPRHRRVCRHCHTGALGDERHMLLECPALADIRDEFSPLIAQCSGVMARLVWARNQPMVSSLASFRLLLSKGRQPSGPCATQSTACFRLNLGTMEEEECRWHSAAH